MVTGMGRQMQGQQLKPRPPDLLIPVTLRHDGITAALTTQHSMDQCPGMSTSPGPGMSTSPGPGMSTSPGPGMSPSQARQRSPAQAPATAAQA